MQITEVQKLQLIRSIGNEATLREDLLLPVFQQMKRYTSVLLTHGPFERGKDFVLIGKDEFGDFVYTAVIVKCKDITMATSARDKELVANLCTQISATINSGYSCTHQNREVSFNRILVVTNGRISHTAREEMVKLSKIHKFTKLTFKSDEDLVRWVDEYLPEYYSSVGGRTSAYLGHLRRRCERLDELKNISIYKGDVRRLLDVFVTPTLFRINKSAATSDGLSEPKPEFRKLDRVIYEKGHILVVGGPGSGKSTLLRAQVQRLLDSNGPGKVLSLPVLMRGTDLVKYFRSTLEETVNSYVRAEFDLPEFSIGDLMNKNSATVYVFIDGLEELPSSTSSPPVFEIIRKFSNDNVRHKVVLSSRDTSAIDSWSLPNVRRWNLLEMRSREIRDFIVKWFKADHDPDSHPLLRALQDHDLLNKLPKTPLVLTLLAILFDHDEQAEVPANLSELYNMFMELLLGRWNLDRRITTFYDANVREFVLLEIAHFMHHHELVVMSLPALEHIIQGCSDHLGLKLDIQKMKGDLLDHTGVLVLNDKREVEFRHLSFQEFLVAKHYNLRSTESLEDHLKSKFNDDWWTTVVYHYCGLRRTNERLLRALKDIWPTYDLIPAMKTAWQFGYLLQSSYLTSIDCRHECSVSFIRYYSSLVTRILAEQDTTPPFNRFPPALFVITMIEMYKLHYSSKFSAPLNLQVHRSLESHPDGDFSSKLAILISACILAKDVAPEYLLDVYDTVRTEPILNYALNFELDMLMQSEDTPLGKKDDIRRIMVRIRRKFREGRTLYRDLIREPRTLGSVEEGETMTSSPPGSTIDPV